VHLGKSDLNCTWVTMGFNLPSTRERSWSHLCKRQVSAI